jgi:hypothetical protein
MYQVNIDFEMPELKMPEMFYPVHEKVQGWLGWFWTLLGY